MDVSYNNCDTRIENTFSGYMKREYVADVYVFSYAACEHETSTRTLLPKRTCILINAPGSSCTHCCDGGQSCVCSGVSYTSSRLEPQWMFGFSNGWFHMCSPWDTDTNTIYNTARQLKDQGKTIERSEFQLLLVENGLFNSSLCLNLPRNSDWKRSLQSLILRM